MAKSLKQPSVMKHQFSQIPSADMERSTFNRDHGYKTTYNSGSMIPIFCDECLPGDTYNVKLSSISRLATPIVPFMDNLYLDFFFFAVPNRLVWDNWERFMGQQDNPDDSTDYQIPQLPAPPGGFITNSVQDYLGIPLYIENLSVNALPFRAINLIWNTWFRDENLQDSMVVNKDDGPDIEPPWIYYLPFRGKRHDYFTSCLPWPVKNGMSIDLPLGDSAPVIGLAKANQNYGWDGTTTMPPSYETGGSTTVSYPSAQDMNAASEDGTVRIQEDPNNPGYPGVYADLSSATAATINSLREAFQLQRMLERDARGGTRYTEILRSHFRVVSPDSRLQRPEYLGGGSAPIQITPIPQTTPTGIVPDVTPQGNLAAVGHHSQSGIGFTKSFVEHSIILGFMSARADLTYQRGLDRQWSRKTKYDFYWPALAHLGESPVYNREIFYQGTAVDDEVFGYQERWAEYRYKNSLITNKMRSTDPQSLDVWHLSQDFEELPVLNSTFIQSTPPVSRVIATPEEPEFVFDGYFSVKCTRPMPMYSVPGLIDHF